MPGARRCDEHENQLSREQGPGNSSDKAEASPARESQPAGKQDNGKEFKIHHYFDYVAGTSTGGQVSVSVISHTPQADTSGSLSAIMLSRLQMDIGLALRQYDIVGEKVFSKPRRLSLKHVRRPKYRSTDMNDALQEVISNALPRPMSGQQDNKVRARYSVKLQNDNQYACHT